MVRTTFKRLLKRQRYQINKKTVFASLTASGYSFRISSYGVEAFKKGVDGRYHMVIELYSDGEIHNGSEITLHEDIQYGPGHPVSINNDKVHREFDIFYSELIKQCKKHLRPPPRIR